MNENIFIIEDDESIRTLLEVALKSSGFSAHSFESAEPALREMQNSTPDLAIFDIMLDGMDGISAVKKMRASAALCNVPVLMLTAKDSELDKVTGLDAGADDYMTKPFSILELCARVRALLRRQNGAQAMNTVSASGININPKTREVTVNGNLCELTFKEFELLYILMQNADRAVTREELLQKVWGYNYIGETRTLDMHIGTLRRKLCDAGLKDECIRTVRGVGYRFIAAEVSP